MGVPLVWAISPYASTRQLVGLNLNRRGCQVLELSSLDDLPLCNPKPQLIVVDVDPEDGLGWTAVQALRQKPVLRSVPLLLLVADAPTMSRLVSLDPVRWTSKPVDVRAFLSEAQACLPQANRRAEMDNSKTFANRVRAIPGGEHMYMCYSCGTCVSSCMIQLTGERTFNPRRLIQKVINGLEEQAYEDRTTWLCSACDLCYKACPQKIHVSGVMGAIKELAIEAGHPTQITTAAVNERTCVACGLCVAVCPYDAVSLVEKQAGGHTLTFASVDAQRCMACGLCAASCRSSSIELVDAFSSEVLMSDLWEWMNRTAPAPIPVTEVAEWAAVSRTVSR